MGCRSNSSMLCQVASCLGKIADNTPIKTSEFVISEGTEPLRLAKQ